MPKCIFSRLLLNNKVAFNSIKERNKIFRVYQLYKTKTHILVPTNKEKEPLLAGTHRVP